MGLFDELLKKPPQPANDGAGDPSSQQQGGQGDDSVIQTEAIAIEKTEEQSISTEMKPIPALPAEPSMTAEEDNSAVLVGEVSVQEVSVQAEPEMVQVEAIATEGAEPADALSGVEPIEENSETTVTENIEVSSTTPTENTANPLGDILSNDNSTEAMSSLLNLGSETVETKQEQEEDVEAESEFDSLKKYIENNIDQSESLIMKIDAAHTAKLEEAAGYKSEKERFASLEENAYKDAERLMIEKGHGERMKSYFIEQLQSDAAGNAAPRAEGVELSEEHLFHDEPPAEEDITLVDDGGIDGSVETALTGLAVQNTVKNTVEKKHKVKKHEEIKEENFSLI